MQAEVAAPRISSSMSSDPVTQFGVGTDDEDQAGACGRQKQVEHIVHRPQQVGRTLGLDAVKARCGGGAGGVNAA